MLLCCLRSPGPQTDGLQSRNERVIRNTWSFVRRNDQHPVRRLPFCERWGLICWEQKGAPGSLKRARATVTKGMYFFIGDRSSGRIRRRNTRDERKDGRWVAGNGNDGRGKRKSQGLLRSVIGIARYRRKGHSIYIHIQLYGEGRRCHE